MSEKITKNILSYPLGFEPDLIIPTEYGPNRFALGKDGKNPLVIICMNPSAAREINSDATINRIISISQKLNHDGWVVFNLYPERSTDAKNMNSYDDNLSKTNVQIMKDYLISHKITEVMGAWGNDQGIEALRKGKSDVINMLASINIKVFYFGTLTKELNPRHPLQRNEKWDLSVKNYLS